MIGTQWRQSFVRCQAFQHDLSRGYLMTPINCIATSGLPIVSQVDHGEKEGALQGAALLDRTLTKGRCLNGPARKMGFGVAQNLRPDKRRALYYRRLELAMGMLRTISTSPKAPLVPTHRPDKRRTIPPALACVGRTRYTTLAHATPASRLRLLQNTHIPSN